MKFEGIIVSILVSKTNNIVQWYAYLFLCFFFFLDDWKRFLSRDSPNLLLDKTL